MIRKNMWTEEELEFLKDNVGILTYEKIGEHIGRTRDAISAKCVELGLRQKDFWTNDEVKYLLDHQDDTLSDIGKALNRTPQAVQCKRQKLGITSGDKYEYDKDFFECIDTEDRAYWLGFIFADGWVSRTKHNATFGIELNSGDASHLRKFNKSISGNVEVKTRSRFHKQTNKVYHTAQIRLFKKKVVSDLESHGVTQDKSYTAIVPSLPQNLRIAFIRGYFDGDGCVRCENKKYPCCDFTSASYDFLVGLKEMLKEYGIKSYIIANSPTRAGFGGYANVVVYRLYVRGLRNAYNFMELIYGDANIYLERKYKKWQKIKEDTNILHRLGHV